MPRRSRLYRPLALLLFLLFYARVDGCTIQAHTGLPPAPHDLWHAWNWDPWLVLGLALTAYLYGRAVTALWRRAGVGRGVRWHQLWCFGLGLVVLAIALISPLDALSSALFSAHMVQHLLLLYVAPLLLVLGAPSFLLLWALPQPWRRPAMRWWQRSVWYRLWQFLCQPLAIWALFGVMLWVWHAPVLYQAAILSEPIHILEHSAFFGTALLFCWLLTHGRGAGRTSGNRSGLLLLLVFTTALHSGLLGALITFAATPLYPVYRIGAAYWGIPLLVDQQIAGLLMWIPVGFFYLGAMLMLIARWLRMTEDGSRDPLSTPVPVAEPEPSP